MSYFVAEDVVHVRSSHVEGFVSACGWDYEPVAVEWADDYEPEAWAACEDCMAGQEPSEVSQEVVTVQGVYAQDDEAHLITGREGGSWLSLCGRIDSNETVDWAGHEWPEAYVECPECAAMVHTDFWDPDSTDSHRESRQIEPSSFAKRVREYRLWIVAQDGFEHRPSDATLAKAMCGVALASNSEQRSAPMGGPTHCHECDRAVGQARRLARPRRELKQKRPSARPSNRVAQHAKAPATKASLASATKEIALYGRRMIVPVRFVRGGLPGLGRRR